MVYCMYVCIIVYTYMYVGVGFGGAYSPCDAHGGSEWLCSVCRSGTKELLPALTDAGLS